MSQRRVAVQKEQLSSKSSRDRLTTEQKEYQLAKKKRHQADSFYDSSTNKKRPSQNRSTFRQRFMTEADTYGETDRSRKRPTNHTQAKRSRNYRIQEKKKIEEQSGLKKIVSFLYNVFFYLLVFGIIASSIMFTLSDKNDASIFGYRFYNVLTNSMVSDSSDSFQAGDLTLVKMANGDEVSEGDIITYRVGDGSRYLTHRMIGRTTELNGVEGDYIITQGDANAVADPPFTSDRVLGKVLFAIPRMGEIIEFARSNFWLCLLLLLSICAFFLVLKAYLFSVPKKKKKRSR